VTLDRKPCTHFHFIERHGTAWQDTWKAAPPGPAAAVDAAPLDEEKMLNNVYLQTFLTHGMVKML